MSKEEWGPVFTNIHRFLSIRGKTLLITGGPGTGKTTFALELGSVLSGGVLYVSTRVTKDELIQQFPWLEDAEGLQVIDATMPPAGPTGMSLEAPEDYFRLPGPLKSAYDMAMEGKVGNLIFDSWDALLDYFSMLTEEITGRVRSREDLRRLILSVFQATDLNLVLVAELVDKSLEFISDGIIRLTRTLTDEKIIRVMELVKLRGMRIEQPKQLITIHGGRFTAFQPIPTTPFILQTPQKVQIPEPVGDPREDTVSTGIRDLDEITEGGFIKGSINILETSANVGIYNTVFFLVMALNAVNLNRRVTFIPSEAIPTGVLLRAVNLWAKKEALQNITIQQEVFGPSEYGLQTLPAKGRSLDEDLNMFRLRQIEDRSEETTYEFVGFDTLEHRYGREEVERHIGRQAAFIKEYGNVAVWIVRDYQREILNVLRPMAVTHWKIDFLYKTRIICGYIPPTPIYAAHTKFFKGYPDIKLTPIE